MGQQLVFHFDRSALTPDKQLFYYMHHALQLSKTLKQQSIFIIGKTRSGKSTTFNWIVENQYLIGAGSPQQSYYILRDRNGTKEDNIIAEIGATYKSVTLVPNKADIVFQGQNICLVDLPGFKDKRSKNGENQVMLASFIINTCFAHTKCARFIIVISDNGFRQINGDQFINSIKQFIKLFDYLGLQDEQKKKIFRSVGILITSVTIINYESRKRDYLQKLKQNQQKIREIQNSNQIRQHFPYIDQLLSSVIQDQRIQLFKMATLNQSPNPSNILQSYHNCGWSPVNLQLVRQHIRYPYKVQFAKLTEEEQTNLIDSIKNKVAEFQRLKDCLGKFIQIYLKDPFNKYNDFQDQRKELKDILQRNIVHEEIEKISQNQNNHIELSNLEPIKIKSSLKLLDNFTRQIQQDLEKKPKYCLHYLNQSYLIPTLDIFQQCFGITNEQKYMFRTIKIIFSQLLEELSYISEIEEGLQSYCFHKIKEAVLISNYNSFLQKDINEFYLKDIIDRVSSQNYSDIEIEQIITILSEMKYDECDITKKYYSLFKMHMLLTQSEDQNVNIEHFLSGLINSIYYGCCLDVRFQHKQLEDQYHTLKEILIRQCNEVLFGIYKLSQQLSQLSKRQKIHNIYDELRLFDIIERYLKQAKQYKAKKKQPSGVIEITKQLSVLYESLNRFDDALVELRSLQKNITIIKNKQQHKKIKQKIDSINNKSKQSFIVISQQQLNYSILVDVINNINKIIFDRSNTFKLEKFYQEIRSMYLKKSQNIIIQNQFTITIPENITHYQLIAYSQYLIAKIKKRKVIILVGKSVGKTTAFYWLRNKPLIENNKRYQLSNSQQPNRINLNGRNSTEIPNIAVIEQGQLLIDMASLYQKDPEKLIIQRYILKNILTSCSQFKFLLLVQHDDILNKEGQQMINSLKFCLQVLNTNDEEYLNCFAVLQTHCQSTVNPRQPMKNLNILFKKVDNSYKMEQYYKITHQQQHLYSKFIESIFSKKLYSQFLKPSNQGLDKSMAIKDFSSNSWSYFPSKQFKIYIDDIKQNEKLKNAIEKSIGNKFKDILSFSFLEYLFDATKIEENQNARILCIQKIKTILVDKLNAKAKAEILLIQSKKSILYEKMIPANFINTKQLKIVNKIMSFSKIRSIQQSSLEYNNKQNLRFNVDNILKLLSTIYCNDYEQIQYFYVLRMYIFDLISQISFLKKYLSFGGFQLSDIVKIDQFYYCSLSISHNEIMELFENKFKIDQYLEEQILQNVKINYLEQLIICLLNVLTDCNYKPSQSIYASIQFVILRWQQRCKQNKDYKKVVQSFIYQINLHRANTYESDQQQYKRKFIGLFKWLSIELVRVNQKISQKICKLLNCDETKAKIYLRILQLRQDEDIIEKFAQFCLQTNNIDLCIELNDKYKMKNINLQLKSKLKSIKEELISKNRQCDEMNSWGKSIYLNCIEENKLNELIALIPDIQQCISD